MNNKIWKNITEVKKANKAIGHHWFDFDAMSFFKTKIETPILHNRYFITSEINLSDIKKYSIREVNDNGSIDTLGEFHSFKSVKDAKEYLKKSI